MSNPPSYESLGQRVGALVDTKNKAYGNSFDDAGNFLKLLYPNGIQPNQYGDALALVRIFDKMKRIATDRDALGESPYQDITGYGLLGLRRVEREREGTRETDPAPSEGPETPVEPESPRQFMRDRLELKGFQGVLTPDGQMIEVVAGNPIFPHRTGLSSAIHTPAAEDSFRKAAQQVMIGPSLVACRREESKKSKGKDKSQKKGKK